MLLSPQFRKEAKLEVSTQPPSQILKDVVNDSGKHALSPRLFPPTARDKTGLASKGNVVVTHSHPGLLLWCIPDGGNARVPCLHTGTGRQPQGPRRKKAEGCAGRYSRQARETGGGPGGGHRALHELTRVRAPCGCPEPGSAAGGPRAACAGEPIQAAEGQLRGDAAAPGQQPCRTLDWY